MDIIFNEESLCGQFNDKEDFFDYLRSEVLKCWKDLEKFSCKLYSTNELYKCKIAECLDLRKLLTDAAPEVLRLKTLWVQLYSGPYREENLKTKSNVVYKSKIEKTPNCITEAHERGGLVFSFKNSDFEEKWLDLECGMSGCETSDYSVPNFTNNKQLDEHLIDKSLKWKGNSRRIEELNMEFEIRFNENNHYKPHFHLSNIQSEEQLSVEIPSFKVLAGKCKNYNNIKAWADSNKILIIDLWNRCHPDKYVEYE